jgi:hypothetical protein
MAPFDMGDPAAVPYEPVHLSNETITRLREASGWSRFVAIAGFVLSGLLALGLIALAAVFLLEPARLWGTGTGNGELVLVFVPLALLLIATLSGAALVWGYGKGVSQFFTHGEPSLTRGFKSLRHFLTLSTILMALTSALKLLTVLGKLM